MSDQNYKVVELDSIKMEDGAKELMSTPEMQPYLRYVEAAMLGGDVDSSLRGIAELPLEKRYVWRVASALKWGFADFEDWNVVVDRKTLKPEDDCQGDAASQISPNPILHVPEGTRWRWRNGKAHEPRDRSRQEGRVKESTPSDGSSRLRQLGLISEYLTVRLECQPACLFPQPPLH